MREFYPDDLKPQRYGFAQPEPPASTPPPSPEPPASTPPPSPAPPPNSRPELQPRFSYDPTPAPPQETDAPWYPRLGEAVKNLPGALWETAKFLKGIAIPKQLFPTSLAGELGDLITGREGPQRFSHEQKIIVQLSKEVVTGWQNLLSDPTNPRYDDAPLLTSIARQYSEISPVTTAGEWRGTHNLARHLEKEPDFLLDIALSATAIGAGVGIAKQGARLARAAHRTIDISTDLDRALTGVNFIDNTLDPIEQARRATVNLRVDSPWYRFQKAEYGMGTIVGDEVITASHVLASTQERGSRLTLSDVWGNRQRADLSQVAPDLSIDVARIRTPLDRLLTESVGIATDSPAWQQRITDPTTGKSLGLTQWQGVEGMSGMGTFDEAGTLEQIYLGTINESYLNRERVLRLHGKSDTPIKRERKEFGIVAGAGDVQSLLRQELNPLASYGNISERLTQEGVHFQAAAGRAQLHSGRRARLRSIAPFTGQINSDIWNYKSRLDYEDFRMETAERLGRFTAQNLPEDVKLSDYDYILNVPTRAASVEKRGFDALGDIAQAFSRETNLPLEWGILEDIAESSQKTLSLAERQQRQPFQLINPEKVRGARILGFDDVKTSGSTAKAFVSALAEAEPEAIDFLTIANRLWTEGAAQWKELREKPTIYESWVKADRERQHRIVFEAGIEQLRAERMASAAAPSKSGSIKAKLQTIFASKENLSGYLSGNEKTLERLLIETDNRLRGRPPDEGLKLHSGQMNLDLTGGTADIERLLNRVDEHPRLFWRFANPLDPDKPYSQDLWQTQILERRDEVREGLPLPDSFFKEGDAPFGTIDYDPQPMWQEVKAPLDPYGEPRGYSQELERRLIPPSPESDIKAGAVYRRGHYVLPESSLLFDPNTRNLELPPSQLFKTPETPLFPEQGRELRLLFGTPTPYQKLLDTQTESVILTHGTVEGFATNIPIDPQNFFANPFKKQFIDISGIDTNQINRTIDALPTETNIERVWSDYLKSPVSKTLERQGLEDLLNPQLQLHSGDIQVSKQSFIDSVDQSPNLWWRMAHAKENTLRHHSRDDFQTQMARQAQETGSQFTTTYDVKWRPDIERGKAFDDPLNTNKALFRKGVYVTPTFENLHHYFDATDQLVTPEAYHGVDLRVVQGKATQQRAWVLDWDGEEVVRPQDVPFSMQGNLFRESNTININQKLAKKLQLHSGTLNPDDPRYPIGIREAFNRTVPLHYSGDPNLLATGTPRIAVVGRSKPSQDELRIAAQVGRTLAESDRQVVSGFAQGTDQAAQLAALQAGGQSISVLPHGLDAGFKIPPEFQRFLDESLLGITPFQSQTRFSGRNAMIRNSWTTAISDATFIIGTDPKMRPGGKQYSGTFATAEHAFRHGRPVFTIDPSLYNTPPAGNIELINRGATPISDLSEIPNILDTIEPLQGSRQLELNLHSGRSKPQDPIDPFIDDTQAFDDFSLNPQDIDAYNRLSRGDEPIAQTPIPPQRQEGAQLSKDYELSINAEQYQDLKTVLPEWQWKNEPNPDAPSTDWFGNISPSRPRISPASQWIKDKGWIEPLQQVADVTRNAAAINAIAEVAWEGMSLISGRPFNPGGLVRAGAETAIALGASGLLRKVGRLNPKHGVAHALPESVPDIRRIQTNEATPQSQMYLHDIFTDAASSGYNQKSLATALSRYDESQLTAIFGEITTAKLQTIADASARFGQKSFQSERDWGSTLVGLFTGDIPNKRQFKYSPTDRDVTLDTGTPWTVERLLGKRSEFLFPGIKQWKERRQYLRENPKEDPLRHIFGSLKEPDQKPALWYSIFPEAKGVAKFFGRYRVATPKGEHPIGFMNWRTPEFLDAAGERLQNIGTDTTARLAIGLHKTARNMKHRKALRDTRSQILERRKQNPELYKWQDPEHFYEDTARSLGIETVDAPIRPERYGSPYSKSVVSRNLNRLPKPLQHAAVGAAGLTAGYYGADAIRSLFFDNSQDEMVLKDPNQYSVATRFPLLKAISHTKPARRLRAHGEQFLTNTFGENDLNRNMLGAALLGEKGMLPKSIKETFLDTGQYHALVQSGMHVNIASNILRRHPIALAAAGVSMIADHFNPPETETVEPSAPWHHTYTTQAAPWAPRWNPGIYDRPKDFKPPFWAFWDTDPKSQANFEDKMLKMRGNRRMDEGFIYQITNPEGRTYVGLSVNNPLKPGGRVPTHFAGRGNKGIQTDIFTGKYNPSDFRVKVERFEDISYQELGQKERDRIVLRGGHISGGGTTYNQGPGGDIIPPPVAPDFLNVNPFRLRDLAAYGVYQGLGILPEALYSRYKEKAKQPPQKPEGIGLTDEYIQSLVEPEQDENIRVNQSERQDISMLTDQILDEIDKRGNAAY